MTVQITLNKVFKQLLSMQVSGRFNDSLSDTLTAYRKRHSCETTLIMLIERWRQAMDNGEHIGLLSTDMSKAFDCLHPPLLLAKLEAYGFDEESLNLMQSYFTNHHGRVKLGNTTSSWKSVDRGCPQDSAFEPLLWNVFQNDLTFSISSNISMYADDHQFYEAHKDVNVIRTKLQDCASKATRWYDSNYLKGNFKKCGTMIIGKRKQEIGINVKDTQVETFHNISLLGVNLDSKLSFTKHISEVCTKSKNRCYYETAQYDSNMCQVASVIHVRQQFFHI